MQGPAALGHCQAPLGPGRRLKTLTPAAGKGEAPKSGAVLGGAVTGVEPERAYVDRGYCGHPLCADQRLRNWNLARCSSWVYVAVSGQCSGTRSSA